MRLGGQICFRRPATACPCKVTRLARHPIDRIRCQSTHCRVADARSLGVAADVERGKSASHYVGGSPCYRSKTCPNSDDAWPFEDAPNLACFTVRSIVNGTVPTLHASHDEDGVAWQMLTSDAADMSQAMLVAIARLIERDRTLLELADMPLEWSASRENAKVQSREARGAL